MDRGSLEEILACPDLPSLPAIAVQVIELTADPNVAISELGATIQADQGLAAKVLRTVNSSFYGLRQRCASINKALVLLGLGPVKSLVLGFSLVSTLRSDGEDDFDYTTYWRRGLFGAVGARCFAEELALPVTEEAFLSGLMQDVGMIAMLRALGEPYAELAAITQDDHASLVQRELETFDIGHAEVGSMLIEQWRMPATLSIPVRYHEQPTAAPPEVADIVRCLTLGNLAHDAVTLPDPAVPLGRLRNRVREWFEQGPEFADRVLARVAEGTHEFSKLFNVDVGAIDDAESIVAQAERRMIQLAKTQPHDREHDAELLGEHATRRDPLTGAVASAGYAIAVENAFTQSRDHEGVVTLVHVAIEGIAGLIAEHDDTVRDETIIGVTALLNRHFEQMGGVIFRTGDLRFAVLLRDTGRRATMTVCEAFRKGLPKSIANWLVEQGVGTHGVRASIGIASLDDDSFQAFGAAEALAGAAERALQVAQSAGGDCVRSFVPKSRAA